ncbi:helix-turn-helix domain-containing protein [Nocardia farcinica]|uniref:helix-turn-helix domain-containing protein n=1 Tax=Nocardia farcinica TaxID=37329 RepID=UPI003980F87C
MGVGKPRSGSDAVEAANAAVAAHLRAERARADMKQTELAEAAHLAVNTIRRLESGERRMTLEQLVLIAEALGVTPGEFLDAAQAAFRKRQGQ